jgi:hypothetical protein
LEANLPDFEPPRPVFVRLRRRRCAQKITARDPVELERITPGSTGF